MKEIIYNYDYLSEEDITSVVVRIKALIINDDCIYIGNENNIFQFPGGHLEEGETFKECLKREILEEAGIVILDSDITEPFMKVTYFNKDWPEVGQNRKSEIYYYIIKTNKKPDLTKTKYTEHEKEGNFKIEEVPVKDAIDVIKKNMPNNPRNKVISPDMIYALDEYLNRFAN